MKTTLIVGGIAVLLIIFFVAQYNRLIRLNVAVDEAFAQIEVQLKRRSDLIPNLVETVKGYAKHEQSTFDAVITARAKATTATFNLISRLYCATKKIISRTAIPPTIRVVFILTP